MKSLGCGLPKLATRFSTRALVAPPGGVGWEFVGSRAAVRRRGHRTASFFGSSHDWGHLYVWKFEVAPFTFVFASSYANHGLASQAQGRESPQLSREHEAKPQRKRLRLNTARRPARTNGAVPPPPFGWYEEVLARVPLRKAVRQNVA